MTSTALYNVPLVGSSTQSKAYKAFENISSEFKTHPCKSDGTCIEIDSSIIPCPTGTYAVKQSQLQCPTKNMPGVTPTTCFDYYECSYVNDKNCPNIKGLKLHSAVPNVFPGQVGVSTNIACLYYPIKEVSLETYDGWTLNFGHDSTARGPLLKLLCSNPQNSKLERCQGLIKSVKTKSGINYKQLISEALNEGKKNESRLLRQDIEELNALNSGKTNVAVVVIVVVSLLVLLAIIILVIILIEKHKKKKILTQPVKTKNY